MAEKRSLACTMAFLQIYRAVVRGKSGQEKSLRPLLPCPGMNVAGLPPRAPVDTARRRRVFDLQVPLTLAVLPAHALAQ